MSFSDAPNWAVNEFAEADLGDLRRTPRLVQLAHALAQSPSASLPEACGSPAMLKGAYRFFENDDIVPRHIDATSHRLDQVPLVLAQDTAEVDWSSLRGAKGLGPLGNRACRGPFVPSTLAFTPDRVPLGLLAQRVWSRDPTDIGQSARRKKRPIQEKESQKWLHRLDAVLIAHDGCPGTTWVRVGDREADVYEVLAAERPAGVELVIRAS